MLEWSSKICLYMYFSGLPRFDYETRNDERTYSIIRIYTCLEKSARLTFLTIDILGRENRRLSLKMTLVCVKSLLPKARSSSAKENQAPRPFGF